jgi:hypothetical protein
MKVDFHTGEESWLADGYGEPQFTYYGGLDYEIVVHTTRPPQPRAPAIVMRRGFCDNGPRSSAGTSPGWRRWYDLATDARRTDRPGRCACWLKPRPATDERLKQNLIAKAETTGAYVQALSQYCKPEAKR